MSLVLDRTTGLVSPQFHVTFDPSFAVAKQDKFDSEWQIKAGFVTQREKRATSTNATSTEGATSPPSAPPTPSPEGAPPPDTHPEGATRKRAITDAEGTKPRTKRKVTRSRTLGAPTGEPAAAKTGTSNAGDDHQETPVTEQVDAHGQGATETIDNKSRATMPNKSTLPTLPNLIEVA